MPGGVVVLQSVREFVGDEAFARPIDYPSQVGAPGALLGVPISVTTEADLLVAVEKSVLGDTPTVFVGLYASQFHKLDRDASYRADVLNSVVYPDGAGLVQEMRKRGITDVERLATTDMILPLMALAADRRWRVGLFGGLPGVAEGAANAIARMVANVDIVAVWDGYCGGPSDRELRDLDLDMVLVGTGAGRQERWAHAVGVPAGIPAILTCGGLFDFLAGRNRRAPKWMQRAGLEWAFRVMLEPRRLLVRYVRGNLYFLRRAGAERRRALR